MAWTSSGVYVYCIAIAHQEASFEGHFVSSLLEAWGLIEGNHALA